MEVPKGGVVGINRDKERDGHRAIENVAALPVRVDGAGTVVRKERRGGYRIIKCPIVGLYLKQRRFH